MTNEMAYWASFPGEAFVVFWAELDGFDDICSINT